MIGYEIVFTGAGGALGAVARGYLGKLICRPFPFATLMVNVVGSFLVGAMIGTFAHDGAGYSQQTELISLGFCGGFTTFSSFSYQTIEMLREGRTIHALLNVLLSMFLSLAAAWTGIAVFA